MKNVVCGCKKSACAVQNISEENIKVGRDVTELTYSRILLLYAQKHFVLKTMSNSSKVAIGVLVNPIDTFPQVIWQRYKAIRVQNDLSKGALSRGFQSLVRTSRFFVARFLSVNVMLFSSPRGRKKGIWILCKIFFSAQNILHFQSASASHINRMEWKLPRLIIRKFCYIFII